MKAGDEAEGVAESVLVTSGVEVAAPEEEPTGLDPVAVVPVVVLSVSAAEEDSTALELSLADSVGVAVVSAGTELEALGVSEGLALVVSMGGIEMGWPAEEHCPTTALETAASGVSGVFWGRESRWGLKHTDLVVVLAGLLDTGGDAAHELGLLAVAGEVEQLGATIALQGREEAAQLQADVSRLILL